MVLSVAAVGLDGEHRARLGALAVDVDRAGAAVARVAADVGAGQPEVVAQEVDEQEAGLDIGLVGLAVDGDRDVLGAHRAGLLRVREGAFGGAAEGPEGQLRGHRPLVFDRSADVTDRAGSGLPAAAPAWRKSSSDGALPARTASASVAANGVSATPVTPIPAP